MQIKNHVFMITNIFFSLVILPETIAYSTSTTFFNQTPYDIVVTYKSDSEITKNISAHQSLTIHFDSAKIHPTMQMQIMLSKRILSTITVPIRGGDTFYIPHIFKSIYIFSLKKISHDNVLQDGELVFYGVHADKHLFKILETLSFPSY